MRDMTAVNLSVHLHRLQDAGYIIQEKTIQGRTPVTYLGITARGRAAFLEYRQNLLELLAQ